MKLRKNIRQGFCGFESGGANWKTVQGRRKTETSKI